MTFTAAQIAARLDGEVVGDSSVVLSGFSPADRAQAGDLTFAENELYLARAEQSAASAILVDRALHSEKKVLIKVSNARVGFARVLPLFFPEPVFAPGIHPTAIVDGSAQVDPTAHVGPYCFVGEQARIGARSILEASDHVGAQCQIGADVHLFPSVTLYARTQIGDRTRIHAGTVVGADGFGYVFDAGAHLKIPQVGWVIIHEDVEIGANTTIDRGALGPTVIGRGTKIDNLVQIGHNVVVGDNCLVVSQVGIAGSTRLGNFVTLAGQVGLAGHLKIGNRAIVVAQSGVMNNIPEGEKWMGSPANSSHRMKRQYVAMERLPDLLRRVAELEKRLPAVEPEPASPQ